MRLAYVCVLGLTLAACDSGDDRGTNQPRDLAGFAPQPDLAQPAPAPGTCGLLGNLSKLSTLQGLHAYPHIAQASPGFLVAWVTATESTPATYRVDAELTDQTAAPLGPNIPLSTDPIAAFDPPSISPDVGGMTVAWTRIGNSTSSTATDIVITTVDSLGQKLDTNGAACQPNDATCGVYPVTSSGTARQPALERPFEVMRPEMPTNGELGLAFVDSRNYPCTTAPCSSANDVFWKLIQSNGTELMFEKQLTNAPGHIFASPRLAFDNVDQALVWRDVSTGTSSDLYFLAIDDMGDSTMNATDIGTSSGQSAQATPDIVWNGTDYALASATGTDAAATVVYQRQSTTGASTLSARGVTFGGSSCTPAIAYDGTGYGVVYQLNCGQPHAQLAFVRIDATGVRYALDGTSCGTSVDPACGVVLIASASDSDTPSVPQIVYGADGIFAIVWMEGASSTTDPSQDSLEIYSQRISCK